MSRPLAAVLPLWLLGLGVTFGGCPSSSPDPAEVVPDAGPDGADADAESPTDGGPDGADADADLPDAPADDAAPDATPDAWAPLLTITMVDVGQGDATLLTSAAGQSLLFDTGLKAGDAQRLGALLWSTSAADSVVAVSHFDADHMGALDLLFCGPDGAPGAAGVDDDQSGSADVRTEAGEYGAAGTDDFVPPAVWDRGGLDLPPTVEMDEYLAATAGKRQTPLVGHTIDLGIAGLEVVVVTIDGEVVDGEVIPPSGENDRSLSLLVSIGGFHMLLPGDLSQVAETVLAQRLSDWQLSLDVLHLSHHGSDSGTSATLLDLLQPEIAVVSVGDSAGCGAGFNPYGHPGQGALDRLAAAGVQMVIQTAEGGANMAAGTCDPAAGETYPRDYHAMTKVIAGGDVTIETDGTSYRITAGGQDWLLPADE